MDAWAEPNKTQADMEALLFKDNCLTHCHLLTPVDGLSDRQFQGAINWIKRMFAAAGKMLSDFPTSFLPTLHRLKKFRGKVHAEMSTVRSLKSQCMAHTSTD